MRYFNFHRLAFLCCCMLFYGAWGCEEQTQAPPPQPSVVARKITVSEPPKAAEPAVPAEAPAASAPTEAQVSPGATPPSQAGTSAEAPAADSKAPSLPAGTGYTADAVTQKVKIDVKGTMADLTEKAAAEGSSLYRARFYNPEGKVDPFAPIFQQSSQKEEATASVSKKKREKRVPQTPLERISLGQLTLVGIIHMPGGDRAIVQEASGKGYVVKKGTYIGTNAGRVVDIEKDRVIIDEEVENLLGDTVARKQELKLQKPFGEE